MNLKFWGKKEESTEQEPHLTEEQEKYAKKIEEIKNSWQKKSESSKTIEKRKEGEIPEKTGIKKEIKENNSDIKLETGMESNSKEKIKTEIQKSEIANSEKVNDMKKPSTERGTKKEVQEGSETEMKMKSKKELSEGDEKERIKKKVEMKTRGPVIKKDSRSDYDVAYEHDRKGKKKFRLKIIFNKKGCIASGHCVLSDLYNFKLDKEFKAILIDGKEMPGPVKGIFVKEIETDEPHMVINAARTCTPKVIGVIDLDTGKRIAP